MSLCEQNEQNKKIQCSWRCGEMMKPKVSIIFKASFYPVYQVPGRMLRSAAHEGVTATPPGKALQQYNSNPCARETLVPGRTPRYRCCTRREEIVRNQHERHDGSSKQRSASVLEERLVFCYHVCKSTAATMVSSGGVRTLATNTGLVKTNNFSFFGVSCIAAVYCC